MWESSYPEKCEAVNSQMDFFICLFVFIFPSLLYFIWIKFFWFIMNKTGSKKTSDIYVNSSCSKMKIKTLG